MIEVRGLTKVYTTYERGHTLRETVSSLFRRRMKEVHAVRSISFQVEAGEMVAFLGPNGAGKSTTLKMLTGVLHPTAGEARVFGLVPWKQRQVYVRRIGAVFGQKSQLLWDIPPIDAFMMNRAIYGVEEQPFLKTLDRLTEILNVREVMRQPTRQLSLGERMKCEFIMAMLHGPELVFLDEPTIGLDVIAKDQIREFIQEMNRNGVTFMLTTHDLDDVQMLARRVIVVNNGEIEFDDSLSTLRRLLGDKKAVRIVTDEPLPLEFPAGAVLLRRYGDREAELEIDMAVLPLKRFIRDFNEIYGIHDMSIEPLPIETVMKDLYAKHPIRT
jgi:ABC-2 type transport system ATP-binding protein